MKLVISAVVLLLFIGGCATNSKPLAYSCAPLNENFYLEGSKIVSTTGSCDFILSGLSIEKDSYFVRSVGGTISAERELKVTETCAENLGLLYSGEVLVQNTDGELFQCGPLSGGA